jgi:hypothetical protein
VYFPNISKRKLEIHKVFLRFLFSSWKNIRTFQVLRSFEVVTFLINKQQNSRNADAFREFFVQLSWKGTVQNHFITMVRRPFGWDFCIDGAKRGKIALDREFTERQP